MGAFVTVTTGWWRWRVKGRVNKTVKAFFNDNSFFWAAVRCAGDCEK